MIWHSSINEGRGSHSWYNIEKKKIPDLKNNKQLTLINWNCKWKKPWIIPKTLICPLHSHNHKTKEKTFQSSEIEPVWKSHGRCSHVYFTNILFIYNISNCFVHNVCLNGSLLMKSISRQPIEVPVRPRELQKRVCHHFWT